MFFSFLAVFPLPESYQNDPKFHFNTLLRSDTQKSSKNVENTTVFWSRRETVFAPPAKADIATAILTNVIEHLVLLFCPPISTPSPPKRCGRIFILCCKWVFVDLTSSKTLFAGHLKSAMDTANHFLGISMLGQDIFGEHIISTFSNCYWHDFTGDNSVLTSII